MSLSAPIYLSCLHCRHMNWETANTEPLPLQSGSAVVPEASGSKTHSPYVTPLIMNL